jgi:alpha-glucoside transport system substrate-binding protein
MIRHVVVAVVLAVSAVLPACATSEAGSVTVLGPWTGNEPGTEGRAFRDLLDRFERTTGISYEYQEARSASQVLRANVQAGNPPDVAMLAAPGELATYIRDGSLHPLNGVIDEGDRAAFRRMWLLPKDDKIYTIPVKANLKSVIWYNPAHMPRVPRTWGELAAFQSTVDTPWCMGLGDAPSSGWPATDVIEHLLLRGTDADTYDQWSSGKLSWHETAPAWDAWGGIASDPGLVHGGHRTAMLTDFGDAGRQMFTDPPGCLMEAQASFAMVFYQGYDGAPRPGEDFDFFAVDGELGEPWTASADLAGMFNPTPQAKALMHFLATKEAQSVWPRIAGSAALTVHDEVSLDEYGDDVSRRMARILRSADVLCFDAADVMPQTMRNAYYRGVMEYLANPALLGPVLDRLDLVRDGIDREDWVDLPCSRRQER